MFDSVLRYLLSLNSSKTNSCVYVVCLCVCVLGTRVSCATAESIEMPFEWLTHVCPRNRVLDGVEIPTGIGNFGCLAHWKALGVSAAVYATKGIIPSSIKPRPHQRQCRQKPRQCRRNRRHCRQKRQQYRSYFVEATTRLKPRRHATPTGFCIFLGWVQKYGSGDGSIQWRPRAEPL